jgi:MFS family permease
MTARRDSPVDVAVSTTDLAGHASGYRRHQVRMLALAAAAFFASAPGQSFLISVFVDDFLAGTGLSRTAFSALYAAGTVVSATAMLVLGRVVDRRGLRVAWLVVAVALAAACGLASVATGAVLAFLALALLRTSGQGSFTLLGTLLVARSFERRRGQAVAVANLGLTLASVTLPPLVALLIVQVGWRSAYQVIAAAVLLVILPLALLVRSGPPRARASAEDAAAAVAFPAAVRATRRGLPDLPSGPATRLLLVLAAPPLIGTALTFHAVSILGERGIGFVAAGAVVGLLGACSALGVVTAGLVIDRVGTRAALLLLSSLVLVATLVLLLPARGAAYTAFAVLGLGMGGVGVLNGTVWARTFGTAQLGRIQGMAQSSMITAAAVAPLVPAASLGLTGSYTVGLAALAVVAATAVVVALLPEARLARP